MGLERIRIAIQFIMLIPISLLADSSQNYSKHRTQIFTEENLKEIRKKSFLDLEEFPDKFKVHLENLKGRIQNYRSISRKIPLLEDRPGMDALRTQINTKKGNKSYERKMKKYSDFSDRIQLLEKEAVNTFQSITAFVAASIHNLHSEIDQLERNTIIRIEERLAAYGREIAQLLELAREESKKSIDRLIPSLRQGILAIKNPLSQTKQEALMGVEYFLDHYATNEDGTADKRVYPKSITVPSLKIPDVGLVADFIYERSYNERQQAKFGLMIQGSMGAGKQRIHSWENFFSNHCNLHRRYIENKIDLKISEMRTKLQRLFIDILALKDDIAHEGIQHLTKLEVAQSRTGLVGMFFRNFFFPLKLKKTWKKSISEFEEITREIFNKADAFLASTSTTEFHYLKEKDLLLKEIKLQMMHVINQTLNSLKDTLYFDQKNESINLLHQEKILNDYISRDLKHLQDDARTVEISIVELVKDAERLIRACERGSELRNKDRWNPLTIEEILEPVRKEVIALKTSILDGIQKEAILMDDCLEDYFYAMENKIKQDYAEMIRQVTTRLEQYDRVAGILREQMMEYISLIAEEAHICLDDEIDQYSLFDPKGAYIENPRTIQTNHLVIF